MFAFILRRLALAIPVLWAVMTLTFLLMRLAPGNPFSTDRSISPEILKALEAKYQLGGTLWQQYTAYLADLARGDLRLSTKYANVSVNEILAQTLPVSLTLGAIAFTLAITAGVGLGMWAATHHNRAGDRAAMLLALGGISIPAFVVAPLAILIFGLWWNLLPVAGWGSLSQCLLPAVCLSLPFAAAIARLTRTSMLEVLRQDFVRTARAKGLPERVVLFRHALKVALLPVVSYAGPMAASILTGSIVIEQIFAIPGLGPFFVKSILNRDLFLVGGTVLVYSGFLIAFNLVVDCLYTFLDRRVQLA